MLHMLLAAAVSEDSARLAAGPAPDPRIEVRFLSPRLSDLGRVG